MSRLYHGIQERACLKWMIFEATRKLQNNLFDDAGEEMKGFQKAELS